MDGQGPGGGGEPISPEQLRDWEISFEVMTEYDLTQVLREGRRVLKKKQGVSR